MKRNLLNFGEMEYRVLTLEHKDQILNLQRNLLQLQFSQMHPAEREMFEWKASWRSEALEHYLKSRWCMGIFSKDLQHIKAYFLAQPILYFEGYTQNLWIEHMYYENQDFGCLLVDLAVKYGKDKHLQRVLFKEDAILRNNKMAYTFIFKPDRAEIFTTKLGT